jgi:hypothetical protein
MRLAYSRAFPRLSSPSWAPWLACSRALTAASPMASRASVSLCTTIIPADSASIDPPSPSMPLAAFPAFSGTPTPTFEMLAWVAPACFSAAPSLPTSWSSPRLTLLRPRLPLPSSRSFGFTFSSRTSSWVSLAIIASIMPSD